MPVFRDSEIVIGLVAPVGTELGVIAEKLTSRLEVAKYCVEEIHVSTDVIPLIEPIETADANPFDAAMAKMDAGDNARKRTRDNAILALGAASITFEGRTKGDGNNPKPAKRTARIVRSLKHPEEVERLREIYPQGFYLIGVNASERRRRRYLVDEKRMTEDEANRLMKRDEDEPIDHGQKLADTFHMADFFVRLDSSADRLPSSLNRIVDIIMGDPYRTPTFDEYAMFLAFTASLRSADLSRQIGAVIADEAFHEVLATGANDCPRAGGGLYWPVERHGIIEDEPHGRDYVRGIDANVAERNELAKKTAAMGPDFDLDEGKLLELLEDSPFRDITEYGRAVHAEMEALMACARNRVSTRGTTLYSTTLPCHNCTKHIVAAGVKRVVYVEPYAKSKAKKLHDDAIVLGFDEEDVCQASSTPKVRFEPFVGVGPRRFFDLFSMRLGSGRETLRKDSKGRVLHWRLEEGALKHQMLPYSYLELETEAARYFDGFQIKEERTNGRED